MSDAPQQSGLGWGEVIGVLLLLAAVGLIVWPAFEGPVDEMPVPAGTPLPPMMAAGWLNADGGLALKGKVVVVDCWATWCVPCRVSTPRLVKLYGQYQPLGVEFVGLTPEGEGELPAIEKFVRDLGVTWPIGYGSAPTLDMLGIGAFPTLIVFGANGKAAWSGWDVEELPNVLDQAIALAE